MMLRFFGRQEDQRERLDERLSAYLDDELTPQERRRLEAQLAEDPDLRAELEALRNTVSLVRDLPSVPAPRNFILSPSMVERVQPAPTSRARRLSPTRAWAAPLLTAATAIVSMLFVVVLAGDLLLPGIGGLAPAPPAPAGVEEGPQLALEAVPEKEAEAKRSAAAPRATPQPKAVTEAPVKEAPAAAVEEERSAEEAEDDRATAAPMGGGAPTEEAVVLASTAVPTAAEEVAVTPTIPAETPLAPGESVDIVEPTPEERIEVTPPVVGEEGKGALQAEGPRYRDLLPWRVLEIALGVATLGLVYVTVRAWRTRRR